MYGEARYICTTLMLSGALADAGQRAYEYHWDNPTIGSNHAAELAAFYDGAEVFDAADETLVLAMRQYWTSFATSGVPVAKGMPLWRTTGGKGSPRLLLHPGHIAMEQVTNELTERCEFWHSIASELV
ncbi:hypothetical protein B0H16DRAFT_1566830, partial [Mycena metata]